MRSQLKRGPDPAGLLPLNAFTGRKRSSNGQSGEPLDRPIPRHGSTKINRVTRCTVRLWLGFGAIVLAVIVQMIFVDSMLRMDCEPPLSTDQR
jgi:hypothetical protein